MRGGRGQGWGPTSRRPRSERGATFQSTSWVRKYQESPRAQTPGDSKESGPRLCSAPGRWTVTKVQRGPGAPPGRRAALPVRQRPAASGSGAAAAAARGWGCAHAGSAVPGAHARPGPLGPPPPPPPGRPRPRARAGPRGCGARAVSAPAAASTHMEAREPALRSAGLGAPCARPPPRCWPGRPTGVRPRPRRAPPSPAARGAWVSGGRRGPGRAAPPALLAVCAPSPPGPPRGLGKFPGHLAQPETLSLWIFVLIFNRAPSSDVAGRSPGHVPRANGRGAARPRDVPAAAW